MVRNLGNAMAGAGITMCVLTGIWVVLLVGLLRNARNIQADPTSIYVSRKNLLVNWSPTTTPYSSAPGFAITGYAAPIDGTSNGGCFSSFSVPNSPTAYTGYIDFINAYNKTINAPPGMGVTQLYEAADSNFTISGPSLTTGALNIQSMMDTLENQQRNSLAFYRFIYCTKTYFEDVLSQDYDKNPLPFLSEETKANLKAGMSNCGYGKVPDTQACVNGGQPGTSTCTEQNLCFNALNESIAAQCLLYDDHVYSTLNSAAPRGVLNSMGVLGPSPGFQVRSPAMPSS